MSRYYSLETIRANAYDVTLANGAKHRCIDPDALLDIEPADDRENVRGEWEHWGSPFSDESEVIDTIVCSVCGARFIEPKDETKGEYNYCPNCGAEMRGEQS